MQNHLFWQTKPRYNPASQFGLMRDVVEAMHRNAKGGLGSMGDGTGKLTDSVLGENPRLTVIRHLARRFDTSERAQALLELAGFNLSTLATFNEPVVYWTQVFKSIEAGLGGADGTRFVGGGIATLMEAAMTWGDGNGVFAAALRHYRPQSRDTAATGSAASRRHSASSGREEAAGFSGGALLIVISGGDSARRRRIRERVNELARHEGVALNLLEEAGNLMRWHLPQSDINAAIALRDGLIGDQSLGLAIAQTYAGQAQLPDQNIAQLFVDGPDKGRYVLNDVPRDTRVGSAAQAVVNDYRQAWPTDKQQQPRAAVVNVTREDGNSERLRHEETLEQAGVGDEGQLQIHPETVAGGVQPFTRPFSELATTEKLAAEVASLRLDYLEMMTALSEAEALADVPMRRVVQTSVYVSGDSREAADVLDQALRNALDAMDSEVYVAEETKIGSWFLRILGRTRDVVTSDTVQEAAATLKRATELRLVDYPQHDADLKAAKAAREILKGFEGSNEGIAHIGSLCVLKHRGRVIAVTLTQEQLAEVRKNPVFLTSPGLMERLLNGEAEYFIPGNDANAEKAQGPKGKRAGNAKGSRLPRQSPTTTAAPIIVAEPKPPPERRGGADSST